MINKIFRYFFGIIVDPKETTTQILKEKFEWKHILLVLIILALINVGFSFLTPKPLRITGFYQIIFAIIGIPVLLISYFISILLFYISVYILGGRNKFKELTSVLSFAFIINIGGSVLAIFQSIILKSEMAAFVLGKMTPLSFYTNPIVIIMALIAILILAYLSYVAHFGIMQIYNLSKRKALIAAYIPFVIGIIYTIIYAIFMLILGEMKML